MLMPVVLLLSLVAAAAFLGNREAGLVSASTNGTTDQDKAFYAAEAGLHRAILKMHSTGCSGSYPIILLSPVKDTAFDGGSYYAYASPLSGSPATIYSTGTYGNASITLTRQNVPMHQATSYSMTVQPGAEGTDTYLQNGGATNNGSAAGMSAVASTTHPMLQFDLSAIPAGSHVTSATLSTYASAGSGSDTVAVHRVMRDWTEAATWSTADGSTAWSAPGGDVHGQPVASTTFAGSNAWLNWDVTALVDRWVKGSLPNQGVQLRAGAAVSGLMLDSSDSTVPARRPKLGVTFLPPCGWSPPATTVTLSPLADTDIEKNLSSVNFGSYPELSLSKGYEAHPLLQFDLSGIPPGSTVQSGELRLYFSSLYVSAAPASQTSKSLTLNVHAVTKQWKELQATWNRRITGTNWTNSGGDYRSTATATKSLVAGTAPGVWLEFDITSLAQEWVDGVTTNNGLILILPTSSTDEIVFSSREAASNRPELVVIYK